MAENNHAEELEEYGDSGITSKDAKVPLWLKLTYLTLPFWGIISFSLFWNGSWGWFDRGYWGQLQHAANTTFPYVNEGDPGLKRMPNYAVPPEVVDEDRHEQSH